MRVREEDARSSLLVDTTSDEVANARGTLETKRKAAVAAERSTTLARDTLELAVHVAALMAFAVLLVWAASAVARLESFAAVGRCSAS